MSRFTDKLTISEYHVGERLWAIEQPLIYEVDHLGFGRVIEVPSGYVTDGATVPRILWSFLPSWGRYSRAAVLHDFLITLVLRGKPHKYAPTRRAADDIFLEAMHVCGVWWPERIALYWGARLFGSFGPPAPNYPYYPY